MVVALSMACCKRSQLGGFYSVSVLGALSYLKIVFVPNGNPAVNTLLAVSPARRALAN